MLLIALKNLDIKPACTFLHWADLGVDPPLKTSWERTMHEKKCMRLPLNIDMEVKMTCDTPLLTNLYINR